MGAVDGEEEQGEMCVVFFKERNQSSNAAKGFHPTQQKLSELFKVL